MVSSGWRSREEGAPGWAQSKSLMHCGRLVVQAQRLMQAVVGSMITGETIRRISEGFVIKGDSTGPEITTCPGSVPRSWAAE